MNDLHSAANHRAAAVQLMELADDEAVEGHRDPTLVDRFLAKALIEATLAVAAAIEEAGGNP